METDENNAVKTRYVKGINYIASISAGNATSYFLFNGHGDVVQTVDKDGEVLNNYDYDIWGNPTLTVETAECAIRYAGEFYDSETGLYYLRARYYNPYIGRFISEDSYWGEDVNPLSLNRYTYAHNDPIQYLDPTGHAVVKIGVLSGVAVATAAVQGILKGLGSSTGKSTQTNASKTGTATKQSQSNNGLNVGNQSITGSKAVSAVKNSSDMEKAISMGSATKVKSDDIKEKMMHILTKTYENTVYNMSNVQAKGGTVQTVFKGKAVMTTQNAFLAANSGQKEFKVDNLFLETNVTKGIKRFAENVLKGNAQDYGNYYKNGKIELQPVAFVTEGDSTGRYKLKGKVNETYVTKEQLQSIYRNTTVTNEMITDLNRILEKYGITNVENIQHFIAQTCIETGYGGSIFENGSDSYLNGKKYGKKYSGVGYIQMTWDYSYAAFATYMILESNPDLKDVARYKNPTSNNRETIFKEYNKVVTEATSRGYNISEYTDIVDVGRDYVAKNYAWETAGYYWSTNGLISANSNTPVDNVTTIVNKWTDSYEARRDAYDIVIQHIK